MGDFHKKPGTPEELAHYGVKGMRWGHRKQEETGDDGGRSSKLITPGSGRMLTVAEARAAAGNNASTKLFMAEAAKMDQKPSEANLLANKKKWEEKFEGDPPKRDRGKEPSKPVARKKLTPEQKKMLKKAAIYGGAGILLYVGTKKAMAASGYSPRVIEHIKSGGKTLGGKHVDSKEFNAMVMHSQMKTWAPNNYFKGEALTREGFTLDAGHTFQRLSQAAETDFAIPGRKGSVRPAYSVTNKEDWNRYLTNFRHEKGPYASFHEVSWKLTKPVNVPSTRDVLGTLQEVLRNEGKSGTESEALRAYQSISGGSWRDSRSTKLVEALKKKGYGAVVDEMDAGVIGEKPLVFFSPESATNKTSRPLPQVEIEAAEKLVTEIRNRKL